ncbi:YdcF family protein [Dyadobacter endophyticus]|uniref:YdcF family protein n=1 Tax=Dyadobacter endophyticus TaxID=1749036 RepID=UPI003CF2BF4A
MFFFLSKAIDFLIMPLSIVLFILIYAFLVKSDRRRRQAVGLTIVSLLLASNSYLVTKFVNAWEYKFVNLGEVKKTYDVGILLSGGLITHTTPRQDHPAMGGNGDRVLQTYLLYKHGKIRKILITGTSVGRLMDMKQGETRQAALLLVSWGVPANDILFEEKARNTRENAVYSGRILNKMFPSKKYLLITSAFHMRRSTGCFEKIGIKTDPFPADFRGGYNRFATQKLVPDPEAFAHFSTLWHEIVGYLVYKAVGYC